MPWKISDVEKHNKGLSPEKKRQWIAVANSALKKCMDEGGTEESCAASAIRQANGVVAHGEMTSHREPASNYEIRHELHQGRKHLVVPVIMMTEGVHSGSHGPMLHLAEELGKFPGSWDGIPIAINHPEENGSNVSANSPHIIDSQVVGRVYNTKMDEGKLRAEAWIDEETIRRVSAEAYDYIVKGEPLDVSVGVFTEDEQAAGDWNNEHYEGIARNHRPDHLALLPGGRGACGWTDGCGIRANSAENDDLQADANPCHDDQGKFCHKRYGGFSKARVTSITHSEGRQHADVKVDRWDRLGIQPTYSAGGDDLNINVGRLRYEGTEATQWNAPTLADFDLEGRWQDLSPADRAKVAAHFLIGTSAAESFADLKLPVVNPGTGKLNEHALRACISGRGAMVQASPKEKMAARRMAYDLLNKEFGADLTVPESLSEQWAKDLIHDGLSVEVNEMSFSEISEQIQAKLDRMDDDTKVHYLKECYQDYFIYKVAPKGGAQEPIGHGGPDGHVFYKRTYTVADDGTVEFTGEAEQVTKEITYTPIKGGMKAMTEKKNPCCPEKVEMLIQNELTNFTEADRDWLLTMDADQIAKLEPKEQPKPETNDQPPQMNREQAIQVLKEELGDQDRFLGLLPPAVKASVEHGLKLHKDERERKIAAIKAAGPEVYTDEELNAMGMEQLDKLASFVKVQEPANYAPLATHRVQGNGDGEMLLPPGVQ